MTARALHRRSRAAWRAPLVVALAAAACYRPDAPQGAPCAPPGAAARCPAGQACEERAGGAVCLAPGAAVDASTIGPADATGARADAGPPDRDGDGVPDVADDCPTVANATQRDEDGDGAGDACDPCPPYPDGASPVDRDHDGLPDACDPFPTTPGDRLAYFEGFQDGLPATWTSNGGFTAEAGDLVATTSAGTLGHAELPPVAGFDAQGAYTLTTEETTVAFSRSTSGVGATLQLGSPQRGISCGVFVDALRSPSNNLGLYALDVQKYKASTAMPQQAGHRFVVSAQRASGDRYGCLGLDRTAGTGPLGIGTTYVTAPGVPALTLYDATARYHWVMLITSP